MGIKPKKLKKDIFLASNIEGELLKVGTGKADLDEVIQKGAIRAPQEMRT